MPSLRKRLIDSAARLRPRPPVCTSVAEWAETTGHAPVTSLAPARTFTRRPPRTLLPEIADLYTQRLTGTQHARYVVPVGGARLVGRAGLVVLPDGSYAAESAANAEVLAAQRDYLRPPKRPTVTMPGDYYSMLVVWSVKGNYYHWTHDTLTRAYRIHEHLPPDTRFVVPAGLSAWQRDTLDAVGVTEDRRVEFDGETEWELERLHFAPSTTNSGSDRPDVYTWLRDAIVDAYGITPGPPVRRIHISRREARKRRLVNEDAVEAVLDELGFETCIAERLSHREQVARFAEAEVIVAAHGAGLTNALFAPPGSRVLDILEPKKLYQGYIFWSLADARAQEYWYMVGDSVERETMENDTFVPIDTLRATLTAMGLDHR